jgi:hypothetical protein
MISSAAPRGGQSVALAIADPTGSPAVSVPSLVSVAWGNTSVGFTASAVAVSAVHAVTLKATANAVTKTTSILVNPASSSTSTWSVTGTVGPTTLGAGVAVKLTGTKSATATTNSSGAFSFTGLPTGTYTLTASKTGLIFAPPTEQLTVNGANISGLTFAARSSTTVGVDVKTGGDQNTSSSTVTSPAFATKYQNELLLAFVSADAVTSPNTTVQSVTGGGLAWALVSRANVQDGTSEIWRAFAPNVLPSASVTATLSQSVVSSIAVMTFTGVSTSGTSGSGAIGASAIGSGDGGAPAASLVTTRTNSMVVGAGNDYDNAIARTPASGQSLVLQDLSASSDTYWVQMQNATVPASGTRVTISDSSPTADRYNLAVCEVLAGSGTAAAPPPPPLVPQLTISTASLAFGSVAVNKTSTLPLTLLSSGTGAVTINSAALTGTGFQITGVTTPLTLNPNQSVTLEVSFTPTTTTAASGHLSVSSSSTTGANTVIALSGTGISASGAQLTISQTSLSFGNVPLGSSSTLPVTLSSNGSSAVTISAAALTGTGLTMSGATFPVTLNPNLAITVDVKFTPTTAGAVAGQLNITSTSTTGAKAVVSITGTGEHEVTLGWSAPSSSADPVAGYHIYRAAAGSTAFQLLNSSVETKTAYLDSSVTAGATYNYIVKSVDSSGAESKASNQIGLTIP